MYPSSEYELEDLEIGRKVIHDVQCTIELLNLNYLHEILDIVLSSFGTYYIYIVYIYLSTKSQKR